MTNTDTLSPQTQLIPASRLERSPLNARRTVGKMGMDELKASLLAHGLMQNLVVTEGRNGTYQVIAGGRRLEAIRSLLAEGKLPEDYAVPCQIVSDDHALEMSLAENMVRLAMHPADQFDAFAALIDQGATAAHVAQRFGVEESLVLKRMKLARVAPQLLTEYRNDGITLECLMAFTLTDDHKRQMKVFKSLEDWQKRDPDAIRTAITERMIDANDKFACFVGVDAYQAEGGSTRTDLFGDEVYLENPELLDRLVKEKLAGIRKQLEAEGWGWVEINPERDWNAVNRCGHLQPKLIGAPDDLVSLKTELDGEMDALREARQEMEQEEWFERQQEIRDRMRQVEQQLSGFAGYDAGSKALAGCYVSIGHDGTLCLDKGLVKPEHRKLLAKLLGPEEGETEPKQTKPKHPLPESLRRDLAEDRLHIARLEIARHPAIALDLLAFHVASKLLDSRASFDGPDIQYGRRAAKHQRNPKEPSAAERALLEIGQSLPSGWRKPPSEAARFEAFRALPEPNRLEWLAYSLALTLQAKLGSDDGTPATAYDAALALTEGNVAAYWRPGKENFLTRINRSQLLALARDTLGVNWAQSRQGDKKAVLVDQLARAFADPEKQGRTPEQVEKLKTWLPAGMAFGSAAAPKSARPRKLRQAA